MDREITLKETIELFADLRELGYEPCFHNGGIYVEINNGLERDGKM